MPLSPPPQLRNPFGKYSSPACHEDDDDDHDDNGHDYHDDDNDMAVILKSLAQISGGEPNH